jgi:hypothetical protein
MIPSRHKSDESHRTFLIDRKTRTDWFADLPEPSPFV